MQAPSGGNLPWPYFVVVTDRPGIGGGTLLFHLQQPKGVYGGDAAAPGTDLDQVDGGDRYREPAGLPPSRSASRWPTMAPATEPDSMRRMRNSPAVRVEASPPLDSMMWSGARKPAAAKPRSRLPRYRRVSGFT